MTKAKMEEWPNDARSVVSVKEVIVALFQAVDVLADKLTGEHPTIHVETGRGDTAPMTVEQLRQSWPVFVEHWSSSYERLFESQDLEHVAANDPDSLLKDGTDQGASLKV